MAIRQILGGLGEAITEGIVFTWIQKGFSALKGAAGTIAGNMGQQATQEMIDKLLGGTGLRDSRGAGQVIAEADISPENKQRIREAILRLEAENPKYGENARRIIARGSTLKPTIKVKNADGTEREIPDPDWKPAGQKIVEDLANCANDVELDIALFALGIADEAPDGAWDETKNWIARTAMPYVTELILTADEETYQWLLDFRDKVTKPYREREQRIADRQNVALAEKVTNPKYWLEILRDYF